MILNSNLGSKSLKTLKTKWTDFSPPVDGAVPVRYNRGSQDTREFLNQLTRHNIIACNELELASKSNVSQFFDKSFFPISFYTWGRSAVTIHSI